MLTKTILWLDWLNAAVVVVDKKKKNVYVCVFVDYFKK